MEAPKLNARVGWPVTASRMLIGIVTRIGKAGHYTIKLDSGGTLIIEHERVSKLVQLKAIT